MKRMLLRNFTSMTAIALGISVTGSAIGATYVGSGTIYALIVSDSSWGADADYVMVSGVSTLGGCPTQNGLVVLMLKDDAKAQRQFTVLLAAKAAGTTVTVDADDTYRSSQGYCYLRHVY